MLEGFNFGEEQTDPSSSLFSQTVRSPFAQPQYSFPRPGPVTTTSLQAQALILVRDPPRERLAGSSADHESPSLLARLAGKSDIRQVPEFYAEQHHHPLYDNHFANANAKPKPISTPAPTPVSTFTSASTMSKRRTSLQAMLVPAFLQGSLSPTSSSFDIPPPPTPTSPSTSTSKAKSIASRTRANTTSAGSSYYHYHHFTTSPGTSTSTTPVTSPRSSPPPAFFLDEDPFANLTAAPIEVMQRAGSSSSSASASSAPKPAAFDATGSMPSLPHTPPPTPTIPRAFSPGRVHPAYQRPAFKARPSLPSLDTLARMNVVFGGKKARKGKVGAGLPFEPWDNVESESAEPQTSTSSSASASASASTSTSTSVSISASTTTEDDLLASPVPPVPPLPAPPQLMLASTSNKLGLTSQPIPPGQRPLLPSEIMKLGSEVGVVYASAPAAAPPQRPPSLDSATYRGTTPIAIARADNGSDAQMAASRFVEHFSPTKGVVDGFTLGLHGHERNEADPLNFDPVDRFLDEYIYQRGASEDGHAELDTDPEYADAIHTARLTSNTINDTTTSNDTDPYSNSFSSSSLSTSDPEDSSFFSSYSYLYSHPHSFSAADDEFSSGVSSASLSRSLSTTSYSSMEGDVEEENGIRGRIVDSSSGAGAGGSYNTTGSTPGLSRTRSSSDDSSDAALHSPPAEDFIFFPPSSSSYTPQRIGSLFLQQHTMEAPQPQPLVPLNFQPDAESSFPSSPIHQHPQSSLPALPPLSASPTDLALGGYGFGFSEPEEKVRNREDTPAVGVSLLFSHGNEPASVPVPEIVGGVVTEIEPGTAVVPPAVTTGSEVVDADADADADAVGWEMSRGAGGTGSGGGGGVYASSSSTQGSGSASAPGSAGGNFRSNPYASATTSRRGARRGGGNDDDDDDDDERRRRRGLETGGQPSSSFVDMSSSSSSGEESTDDYGQPSAEPPRSLSQQGPFSPYRPPVPLRSSRSPSQSRASVEQQRQFRSRASSSTSNSNAYASSLAPPVFPAVNRTSSSNSSSRFSDDEDDELDQDDESEVDDNGNDNNDDDDDDDVPLAQRIPGALTAQKTIRRQVREERDQKRKERALRKETVARTRSITLRPAGAGGGVVDAYGMPQIASSSHDAAMHAAVAVSSTLAQLSTHQNQPLQTHQSRQRTQTLPGKSAQMFNAEDLARKLQNVQISEVAVAPASYQQQQLSSSLHHSKSTRSSRDFQQPLASAEPYLPSPISASHVTASRARSIKEASSAYRYQTPNSPSTQAPPLPTLRPMRSFRRPSTGEQRPIGMDDPRSVPLPVDAEQRIGRSSTSASRTSRDVQQQQQPQMPLRRSLSQSRTGTGSRRPSTADGPVPPLPISSKISQDEHRKLVKPFHSGDVSRVASTRTSVDVDRSPRTIIPQQRPQLPSGTGGETVAQQRVFIGDMQRFNMVQVGSATTAGDVIQMIEDEGSLVGWVGSGGWMVFEVAQDFGMERPIRSFELIAEVQASWNKDKMVNCLVLKMTPLGDPLSRSAIPSSSPTHSGYVEWEVKRGKWSKRWMQLREHSIWLSKRDNGRDEVLLCSLSNFDAYRITRSHRAPKPFAFAVKSTDNLSYFENTADYLHSFACSEKDGKVWLEKILVARSYVLHQERHVLFNPKSASSGTASVSRSNTKKISATFQRPAAQPLVALPPLYTGAAQSLPQHDVFEPGSLLSKHI